MQMLGGNLLFIGVSSHLMCDIWLTGDLRQKMQIESTVNPTLTTKYSVRTGGLTSRASFSLTSATIQNTQSLETSKSSLIHEQNNNLMGCSQVRIGTCPLTTVK